MRKIIVTPENFPNCLRLLKQLTPGVTFASYNDSIRKPRFQNTSVPIDYKTIRKHPLHDKLDLNAALWLTENYSTGLPICYGDTLYAFNGRKIIIHSKSYSENLNMRVHFHLIRA